MNIFQKFVDDPTLIYNKFRKKQNKFKSIKVDVTDLTEKELKQLIKHIEYKKGEVIGYEK